MMKGANRLAVAAFLLIVTLTSNVLCQGWWRYDHMTDVILEEEWLNGATEFELMLAGVLYNINFQSNLQIRLSDQTKIRRIKRALTSSENKDVVEEPNNIEVTRIKRDSPGENRDLTVLLVNDQQRDINSRLGRFQNVKPVIGLLTSTARTFIQDGVTTEFATQILGTTLDNGRIYAQLLTKSSLVLYNKPSRVDDTSFIRPTSLPNEGKWSVKQDLGFIDPNKFVLKNTDYLKPQNDKMYTVYASKPSYLDRTKVWGDHKVENDILSNDLTARKVPFNAHQAFSDNNSNNLENSYFDNERILEQPTFLENVNSLHRHRPIETVIDFVSLDAKQDETPEVIISKVKPDSNLPTYTVKNEFSPIFYYIDNVESKPTPSEKSTTKLPKKMFGGSGDNALKKTFTYAGFADFTTEVGDTVIVFTPNTIKENKPGGIEILQPSVRTPQRLGTKITHLSGDIPIPTKVYTSPRPAFTRRPGLQDLRNDKALHNGEKELKDVLYEDDGLPDSDKVQNNMNFGFNMDAIQPSESLAIIPQNTEITDDLEVIPIATNRYEPTPILKTIKSSPTIKFDKKSSTKAKHVYTTTEEPTSEESTEEDSDFNDDTTEDTLATTFDETDESTEVDDEDTICTNGIMPVKTMTTQYKTLTYLTTYFIPLDDEGTTTSIKSDVVIESTLGFLTNYECKSDYFSPSSVVKYPNKATLLSSEEAENTSSEEFDFDTTTLSSKKNDLKSEEEDSSNNSNETDESEQKSTTKSDARTENIQTTTEKLVQKPTTPEEKPTTEKTTTENLTTEKATTTTERVEFSVTTDESIKVTPEEKEVKEPTEDSENEIDLIYKTLYTTYTYFTTFFHGKSSTVASHKSVVTNVITSTLDLSKLDPSLLDAFEKAPIIPTRVEGQKPTESLNSVIDLFKNKNVLESVENELNYNSQTPTPILNDEHLKTINPDAVKTYYTTYTFFTTIYVGSDANICSRSEVHTNYIGPDTLLPTKSNPLTLESTKKEFDFRNCRKVTAGSEELPPAESGRSLQDNNKPIAEPSKVVYDMLLSVEAKPINTAADSHVTDVKSSTSKGKQKIIEDNNLFEDQVSSESNIEEIIPSPTLLLQTSYTTFTYFTTLYMGKDSSKIKSHLETITNVVTETIPPQKEPETEEPITYYTTFTYWTTLYKDKITTITSREEVISNVVDPTALPTKEKPKEAQNPIDTTPIEVSSVHQKELEEEIKPTQKYELITDEEKATFYTTYTYFTTFYVGNTSQIRSSLETITNIVDNTRSPSDDNQLGRSVGVIDNKNIIDRNEKPAVIKEKIEVTKVPVLSVIPTVLSGSNIDNILTEVSSPKSTTDGDHKKIIFSQVAVISGDSTIISDGKELKNASTSTAKTTVLSPKPEVVESSITEPTTSTETHTEDENDEETDDGKKKSRLTFTTRKPSFVPVIRPFSSRGRPSFSPKKVPLPIGATTITRSDITPTITATPILKTSKSSGFGSRKAVISPSASPAPGRRFTGRSSTSLTSASPTSSTRTFGRGRPSDVQPTSRRSGYRSSTSRNANLETTATTTTRPASRIRPTIGSRLRGSRIPASVVNQPVDTNIPAEDVPEEQTTDNISEQTQITSEPTVQRTTNPLLRFRRPLSRSPGSAVTSQRPTTPTTPSTTKKPAANKGKLATTTTQKSSQKPSNQVNILKSRLRPNALFPRRNLFKQPEPEPEEENVNEQPEEEIEENAEGEAEEQDNDYESSDKLEQPVTSTTTIAPRRSNQVQIKPFAFKRRSKRQADYGARKINIARRPALRSLTIDRRSDPEPDTEPPVAPRRTTSRFTARPAYVQSSTPRQQITSRTSGRPYIIRGETRATAASSTTSLPAFKTRTSRPPPRGTTARARLSSYGKTSTQKTRTKTGRARTRGSTRTSSRFRGNDYNVDSNSYMPIDDGKITITHHIPTEVTIPVVSGRITEYKNVLTAKPSQEVLLPNQYSTSVNALGNPQLVLLTQSTEVLDNGATKLIKFVLNETPTKTVIFTPTTIRGRKTSYSHIVPSTVYNVEYVTQTIQPDINPNVPLANILLSQLLLGNAQQPGINNLLPLQGPGFLPQMPVAQTPVTELRTKPTTYVTTITDVREKVLPITFRGKEILTTIKDPTVKVITATEFITETIVTTPTMYAPQMNQNQLNQNQLNSLLLPLLLQQQQQQQQAMSMQTQNPVSGLGLADLNLLQNNKLQFSNDLFNSPKPDVLEIDNNEDYGQYDDKNSDEDVIEIKTPKLVRPRPVKPLPHKVTSVVTLYVSGKTPGEFSTLLSTVISEDTQTVRKREAIYFDEIMLPASDLPLLEELYSSSIDNSLEINEKPIVYDDNNLGTQSLESIVGEVSKYINLQSSKPNQSVTYKLFENNDD